MRTEISSSQGLDPGTIVAGRFRIDSMIAKGGMGAVYLAHQQGLDRHVALKTLKPMLTGEDREEFAERFQREAKSLGTLTEHPNIVTVFDYGEASPGEYYLVMEYVDGCRFNDLLKIGRLEPNRAVRLVMQVCDALQFAHSHGVVHRDIKLSNVLVYEDYEGNERVKVVDFGLAKISDSAQEQLTRAGMVLGSPHFMSPEQIREDPIDHRTDIYSVGVLLFCALTGKYPFHGETKASVIAAHLTKSPPAMEELVPGIAIPERLEQITRRCLHRDPDNRWPDLKQMHTALEAALQKLGAAPPPPQLEVDDTLRVDTAAAVSEVAMAQPTTNTAWAGIAALLAVGGGAVILAAFVAFVAAVAVTTTQQRESTAPTGAITDPEPVAAPATEPYVDIEPEEPAGARPEDVGASTNASEAEAAAEDEIEAPSVGTPVALPPADPVVPNHGPDTPTPRAAATESSQPAPDEKEEAGDEEGTDKAAEPTWGTGTKSDIINPFGD